MLVGIGDWMAYNYGQLVGLDSRLVWTAGWLGQLVGSDCWLVRTVA